MEYSSGLFLALALLKLAEKQEAHRVSATISYRACLVVLRRDVYTFCCAKGNIECVGSVC